MRYLTLIVIAMLLLSGCATGRQVGMALSQGAMAYGNQPQPQGMSYYEMEQLRIQQERNRTLENMYYEDVTQ